MAEVFVSNNGGKGSKLLTILDCHKIEDAVRWINQHLEQTAIRGMIEIGDFVLREFFDDDITEAESPQPNKLKSYRALTDHADLAISRTKLNNCVGLAILKRECLLPEMETMKLSHIVALLPLRKKPQLLSQMVERISHEQLTYREISDAVRKLNDKQRTINCSQKIERDLEGARKRLDRVIEHFHDSTITTEERDRIIHQLDNYIGYLLQVRNEFWQD